MVHQQGSLDHKRVLDKVILSPFQFLVAIEGLIYMVKTTNTNGYLNDFDVDRAGRKV